MSASVPVAVAASMSHFFTKCGTMLHVLLHVLLWLFLRHYDFDQMYAEGNKIFMSGAILAY